MPIVAKTKSVILTTTTTTALLTAGASETIRITHITASCGSTAGTITLQKFDNSEALTTRIWNDRAITANGNLEFFDTILEANDELQGGYATASDAELVIDYLVET